MRRQRCESTVVARSLRASYSSVNLHSCLIVIKSM